MPSSPITALLLLATVAAIAGTPDEVVGGPSRREASRPPAGAAKESLTWRRDESSLALVLDGRPVWRFRHDEKLGKPHFDALAPLGGPAVTWTMPPDHVWHYGLWFSWKYLNGVNYWEEDRRTHRGEGHTTATRVTWTPREDHSARIEMELSYHLAGKPPEDAVLTETRSIEVSPPQRDGSYHLDWTARFTAGAQRVEFDRTPLPGEKGGQTYGGYAGLSLRMRDLKERRAVSSRGPVLFSAQNRFRGKATAFDYSGVLDGEAVGVAICDHPKNRSTPSPWYAIRSGAMTFFSPAVICFKPFVLEAGESLELRYRVLVHKGRLSEEQLRSAYTAYVER